MPKILIVEDSKDILNNITMFLENMHYTVDCADNGMTAMYLIGNNTYDVIVLDIMLPGSVNGYDICRTMRECNNHTPVIMLTARGEEMDRILGLELGADDYLPKPCNPRALAARIRAILRRSDLQSESKKDNALSFGSLTWLPQSRTITESGTVLDLTATEYNILAALMEKAGEVVDKQSLSQAALGKRYGPFDRTLDVHIGHLRKKLKPLTGNEPRIKTVRAVGWLFVPE